MCIHMNTHVLPVVKSFEREFGTSRTGSELVWFHWYISSREKLVISHLDVSIYELLSFYLHSNRACKSRERKRGWGQKVHILHVNV